MGILALLLALLGAYFLLEQFVKPRAARLAGLVFLGMLALGIGVKLGLNAGRADQLNRHRRLVVDILLTLDRDRSSPEVLAKTITELRQAANKADALNQLEIIITERKNTGIRAEKAEKDRHNP